MTVRLSDAFPPGVKSDIELTVTIYNINYPRQAKLLRDCRPMHDYSFFIDRIRQNGQSGLPLDAAVEEAMRYCIRNDIMKEYLEKHRGEVSSMVDLEWNEDDARESYIAQGEEKGNANMIRKFLAVNTPMEYIIKATGWTEDKIREVALETPQ